MRINNNIMALNAHRQLGMNQAGASKSMEKLSSGFRINRAGDDAAGLAISEKMRGQIRGLKQAQRNAQDGISLIQTAEGSLNETHAILQRMRELAAQAANDTNTEPDRGEIQKELDQLKSEIDRIGNTTEFNTMRLIDGSQAQQAEVAAGGTIVDAKATDSLNPGDYTVTVANKANVAANFNGASNLDADDISAFGVNVDIGSSFKIVVSGYDSTGNGSATITLQDGSGQFIASVDVTNLSTATTLEIGGDAGITFDASGINADGTTTFDFGVKADYSVVHNGVTTGSRTGVVTSTGAVDVGGFQLEVNAALTNGENTINVSGDALRFQIGANENQSMRLSMADMRATALGVDQVSVDSHETAKSAITTIDKAIGFVSGERSKLGAVQNRLEHTISNLGTSAENLQAAESRIRDLDMADEIMAFTKNNILQQAATAMLAQANMAPQSVLQLLG